MLQLQLPLATKNSILNSDIALEYDVGNIKKEPAVMERVEVQVGIQVSKAQAVGLTRNRK